jgi:hypothetical protein
MRVPVWCHLVPSLAASVFLLALLIVSPARASNQLDSLYSQVLKHPEDSQLRAFFVWAESNSPQEDSQKGGVERVFGV